MRITIQVTCEDVEDAQRAIKKLAAPDNTWVDQVDARPSLDAKSVAMRAQLDATKTNPEPVIVHVKQMPDGSLGVPDRANSSPGEPAIGKIGSESRAYILQELKARDRVPDHFGRKFTEHLKLLWKRGEIKWDGQNYYL